MRCFKCKKEMGYILGGVLVESQDKHTLKGIEVKVRIDEGRKFPSQIEYNNTQLGKYSDGNGECHVAICYECYLDGLFQIGR